MKKSALHLAAAMTAVVLVATFWASTVVVELFGSFEAVAAVKRGILFAIPMLVLALIVTNISGMRASNGLGLGEGVRRKRRRAVLAAINGIVVLVPAAFVLDAMAARGEFAGIFITVQAIELVAGAFNFYLLASNVGEGRRLAMAVRAV